MATVSRAALRLRDTGRAMSRENVELVRRAYEEFGRTRQAPSSALDPEIEWHTAADLPDSGVHHGHVGVAALIQEWVKSFEDFRTDVDEFIDRGEYVVVLLVLRGRIRGSDEEVALPETHVWNVHEGRVVEVREYRTLEQALDAVSPTG
jgi:ketosteroid isomerase-like protein